MYSRDMYRGTRAGYAASLRCEWRRKRCASPSASVAFQRGAGGVMPKSVPPTYRTQATARGRRYAVRRQRGWQQAYGAGARSDSEY